jgi:hypothetical protein
MAERYTLGPDAVMQLKQVVRAEVQRLKTLDPGRARWVKGGGCKAQNCKLQLTILGSPTGGTFDWDLSINDSEETLTFAYDDTAAEVATELATHTKLTSDDVTVTGGPFPDSTIEIEFIDAVAKTDIAIPIGDWGSLTGGTGVAVLTSKTQLGYPK